ncbi:serrate RNA effector molecule homolog [Morus notabilis]|uniref:serrate RNA effector molecule homolog n=1 Tax=Morus notabilis TaxID=981085 RepID=UPI000CED0BB3|nr:serrate RNA effector molecule homolog [Morus notabilis]XP_024020543.1 serrate RNA effector molecule homolog [Morus notabilis]
MPSGAKKRKAAKKKKELEANNNGNPSNNPQEHDDAKSQDEKGSDGGEVSSPAHEDHHNNNDNPFNEGNEVRHPSAARSVVVEDNKSMEKVPSGVVEEEGKLGGQDGDDVAKVERGGSKSEGDSERSISIEGFEFSKISNDGDDKSSSSSSSSSSDDESQAVEKKENKSEATKITKSESSGDANLVEKVSSIIESVTPVVPVLEETLSVVENAIVDNSLVSEVVKLDTGREKLANKVSETVTSFSPEKYEDKIFSLLDQYTKPSPSELESDLKVDEDKELPPSQDARVAETTTGTEYNKNSEKEPLVAPAPALHPVQRTSWLSCCGILDLLSGSSR